MLQIFDLSFQRTGFVMLREEQIVPEEIHLPLMGFAYLTLCTEQLNQLSQLLLIKGADQSRRRCFGF